MALFRNCKFVTYYCVILLLVAFPSSCSQCTLHLNLIIFKWSMLPLQGTDQSMLIFGNAVVITMPAP